MPSFDVDTTAINAFEVEDANVYIFSQYFTQEDVFAELREYYDRQHNRFEVPATEIDEVDALLDELSTTSSALHPTIAIRSAW